MAVARQANENKVAHAMSTHSRMATQQWRHRIKIKDLFTEESTHEVIDALCRRAVSQIDAVIKSERQRRDQKDADELEYFTRNLEIIQDDFDSLIGAAGEYVEERETQFNHLLSELYDIADAKIELRDGLLQKFCWIS